MRQAHMTVVAPPCAFSDLLHPVLFFRAKFDIFKAACIAAWLGIPTFWSPLMKINPTINGKKYSPDVEPRLLLVHYLRDVAGLTGSHIGCETSLCGACTVELDGKAVKSCSMFAVQADGA